MKLTPEVEERRQGRMKRPTAGLVMGACPHVDAPEELMMLKSSRHEVGKRVFQVDTAELGGCLRSGGPVTSRRRSVDTQALLGLPCLGTACSARRRPRILVPSWAQTGACLD